MWNSTTDAREAGWSEDCSWRLRDTLKTFVHHDSHCLPEPWGASPAPPRSVALVGDLGRGGVAGNRPRPRSPPSGERDKQQAGPRQAVRRARKEAGAAHHWGGPSLEAVLQRGGGPVGPTRSVAAGAHCSGVQGVVHGTAVSCGVSVTGAVSPGGLS